MLPARLGRIVARDGPGASEAVAMRMSESPLLLFGAMVVLAALDFVGAVLAKEWATERNHWLFAVYAVSLKLAELSTVTFGWIVTLQVGLLLLERVRYAVVLPSGKWAAIVAILVLQAYLILAPNGETP